MIIELTLPNMEKEIRHKCAHNFQLDDIRSILDDVCDLAEDICQLAGYGKFCISGFGQYPWPLDVRTDLSVFLEQLPDAIHAISSGSPVEIDLYEQGIERTLSFLPKNDYYDVICHSRTEWQPDPPIETIGAACLLKMLKEVQDTFVIFTKNNVTDISYHPLFLAWTSGNIVDASN